MTGTATLLSRKRRDRGQEGRGGPSQGAPGCWVRCGGDASQAPCLHAHVSISVCLCMHRGVSTCVRTAACLHMHMRASTCVPPREHVCKRLHVLMSVCAHVSMPVHMEGGAHMCTQVHGWKPSLLLCDKLVPAPAKARGATRRPQARHHPSEGPSAPCCGHHGAGDSERPGAELGSARACRMGPGAAGRVEGIPVSPNPPAAHGTASRWAACDCGAHPQPSPQCQGKKWRVCARVHVSPYPPRPYTGAQGHQAPGWAPLHPHGLPSHRDTGPGPSGARLRHAEHSSGALPAEAWSRGSSASGAGSVGKSRAPRDANGAWK